MQRKGKEKLGLLIELANGDEAFIREMIDLFLKNAPLSMATINESIAKNDLSSCGDMAHKLKSSVQIIGDADLHDLIKDIEKKAKENTDSKELISLIDNLNSRMNTLFDYLSARLKDPSAFK